MTRRSAAKARRAAAENATRAADDLLAWLRGQPSGTGHPRDRVAPPERPSAEDAGTATGAFQPPTDDPPPAALEPTDRRGGDVVVPAPRETVAPGREADGRHAPLRLAHTDWLHHRLRITGPEADLTAFRAAAAGAGTIPWQFDLEQMEEDLFHLLVAPPTPAAALHPPSRSLSFAGARILAGQLRTAVARRQELAVARVGLSRACPFDLHALVPVPEDVLWRGPDDPQALAWLWQHWGTTHALRRVAADGEAGEAARGDRLRERGRRQPAAGFAVTFWSADWTPWRALAQIAERWPALRFDTRPSYDAW